MSTSFHELLKPLSISEENRNLFYQQIIFIFVE